MINELADLGTPIILLICDPSLVLQTPTVLSVKKMTANFQHLDNLAVLGQEFLRICAQTSCWIKSNTSTASFVIINAYLSAPPSCKSFTPIRTDILPLLQHGFHYILVYNFILIELMENKVDLSSDPEEITDLQVKSYMQCFLDINDFKRTENAKNLLQLIREYPDHSRTKSMLRTVIGIFNCNLPAARVCSLQFLKQALQTGSYFVLQSIEKNVLNKFAEIIQYRSGVKGLSRGSTYFIRDISKNIDDEEFMTLVRLSSTFFRMVQQCLYVWGAFYFPNSAFDRLRLKMGAKIELFQFPKDFKFFSETKVTNFKLKCKNLIQKISERKPTSIITSKKSIINKELDKKPEKLSERNLKKQQQTNRSRQKSQQQIENLPSSLRGQKKLPSKKKKQKKKFVESDEQKQQREQNQKLQRSIISNNSSKLRKKNSFDEAPIIFHHNSSPQSSSDKLKRQQKSSKVEVISNPNNIVRPITEREQSQGGRYSMKQSSIKSSNPSEQIRDIYENQKVSPRSQLSVTEVLPEKIGLKRQISQQLSQPSTHLNAYNKKENNDKSLKFGIKIDPKIEKVNNKVSIHLPIDQGKKKLKNEEIQTQDKWIKSSKRKRLQNSTPKKFVSSQQQNNNDQKEIIVIQSNNKANKFVQKNNLYDEDSVSNFSNFNKQIPKNVPPLPASKRDSKAIENEPKKIGMIEAVSINSSPQNLKGPIKQNNQNQKAANVFMEPLKVQRASKPQKIKSNTNLQTIFQSTDFKITTNNKEPKQQKVVKKATQKSKQIKQGRKIDIFAEASSKNQQKSIFNAVELSSIKTVQQINLINKPNTQNIRQENFDLDRQNKVTENKNQTRKSFQSACSDEQNSNHQQLPPSYSQQNSNLQKQLYKTTVNEGNYINENRISQKKENKGLKNIPRQTHKYNRIEAKVQSQHQSNSNKFQSKPNLIKTSRQFRHFKEVNLFIDPSFSARLAPSQDYHEPIKIESQQIESVLKERIRQEFYKLRKELISKQQQNLNNTLTSLKSQIQESRREKMVERNQCSTQTKIRHKSKSKFEKKRVKINEDDEIQNKNDHNNPTYKFSKTSVQTTHQNHHSTNIGNSKPYQSQGLIIRENPKKQQNIKQQMKPNTLLYALYRRKSINI